MIYSAVKTFVQELTSGVPATTTSTGAAAADGTADGTTANGPSNSSSSNGKAASTANGTAPAASGSSKNGKSSSTGKDGVLTHSLSLKERFYCRASDIFDCFVVEGKVKGFTQSAAEVNGVPGGRWSWFGGSITGSFEEMEVNEKLVMTWRFSSWEEGVESKVRGEGG